MKKLVGIIALLMLLSAAAQAQMATCSVTGVIYRSSGIPAPYTSIYIVRVVKDGALISNEQVKVTSNFAGVITFTAIRNSDTYLRGPIVGLDITLGKRIRIPDAATADLADLISNSTIPPEGLTTKDDGVSLPNKAMDLNFTTRLIATDSPAGQTNVAVDVAGLTSDILPNLVTAGSCTTCNLTFDAKGRITAASNGSGGVTSLNTRTGAVTLTSGDVTGALGYTPRDASASTVNTFNGRTGTVTLASSDVTSAIGFTPFNVAGDTLTGTAGAGFAGLPSQSSNPSSPSSGLRLFADSSGRFSWRRASDGFIRTWDATLTANRVYTLPDADSKIPVFSQTITFSGPTLARTVTLPDANFTVARTDAGNTWTGNQIFSSDNAYDIGASGGSRPRTGYFGTSIIVQGPTGFVNGVTLSTAASGSPSSVAATGSDTNINLNLAAKGTGIVSVPLDGAKVFSTASQTIANAAATAVVFDTETNGWDTSAYHDNTTNNTRLTVPRAGYYSITCSITWVGNTTGQRVLYLRKNGPGGDFLDMLEQDSAGANRFTQRIVTTASLAAGDYVELLAYQSSGGNLDVQYMGAFGSVYKTHPTCEIRWLGR